MTKSGNCDLYIKKYNIPCRIKTWPINTNPRVPVTRGILFLYLYRHFQPDERRPHCLRAPCTAYLTTSLLAVMTKGARIACGRLVLHILRPPYLPLFIIIIFPFPQEEKPAPEAGTDRHWNDLSHGENLFYRQTRNQLHAQQASQYTNQEEAGNKDQKLFHRGHFRLFHSNLLLYKSENFCGLFRPPCCRIFRFMGEGVPLSVILL